MKKLSTLLLSGGLFVFAACGDVKIDAAPIGEVDFAESKTAFFSATSVAVDADLDGTVDDQLSSLLVVLANDPELCAKLEADPNALNTEADARLVSINLTKIDIDGTDAIIEGDLLSNTDLVDANGAPIDSSAFALLFAQRINGVNAVTAVSGGAETDIVTVAQFDAEAGDIKLEINAALTQQVIDGAAEAVNLPVSIQVRSATQCNVLSAL
jgi:hypothetical protein